MRTNEIKECAIRKHIHKAVEKVTHSWDKNQKVFFNRIRRKEHIIEFLMQRIDKNIDNNICLMKDDLSGVAEKTLDSIIYNLAKASMASDEYDKLYDVIPF